MGVVLAAAAVVVPVVLWWADSPAADLRVDGLSVAVPSGAEEGTATVRVTLHNAGEVVTVVRAVEVEVLAHERLPICEAGGGIVPSATYGLVLPVEGAVGSRLRFGEPFEVTANRADAFELQLSVPEAALVSDDAHMYQLRVRLLHSGSTRPLDAGVVVVPVPSMPDSYSVSGEGATIGGDVGECYAGATEAYERASTWDGARPPGMPAGRTR